jgi:phosphoribosylaminoimidazole carboxylase PurK protein
MIEKIGIVGGGQLGRMLTQAAQPLGFQVTVLDSGENAPAAQVGAGQVFGELTDPEAIAKLAEQCDVLTWEIEHIDSDILIDLERRGHDIQPSPHTLKAIQDKYEQKKTLQAAGLPVPPFRELPGRSWEEGGLRSFREQILRPLGEKVIVKTRTGGYDGRGNHVFDGDLDALRQAVGTEWSNLYVEQIVPFQTELSVISARDRRGNVVTYPTVETVHEDNICHMVMCPPDLDPDLSAKAQELAHETMKLLDGAGVFAIEMFAVEGKVLINEIAPRVHNSGHHTIEANQTSQFEQHIRAITGMPLGSTAQRTPAAVMINILGGRTEPLDRLGMDAVLTLPDTHLHFYGKSARAGRKIGHITVLGDTVNVASALAQHARAALKA